MSFSVDLIVCDDCWPGFTAALAPLADRDEGCPGSWSDDPDDAVECDLCGRSLEDEDDEASALRMFRDESGRWACAQCVDTADALSDTPREGWTEEMDVKATSDMFAPASGPLYCGYCGRLALDPSKNVEDDNDCDPEHSD